MTDIDTKAIEYGRGWVYVTHNHNINVYSIEEELRVREYMIRGQGYAHLHTVDLPPEPGRSPGWCLCFSRFTTFLDTNLGDPVQVEKRYKVKDA